MQCGIEIDCALVLPHSIITFYQIHVDMKMEKRFMHPVSHQHGRQDGQLQSGHAHGLFSGVGTGTEPHVHLTLSHSVVSQQQDPHRGTTSSAASNV